MEILDAVNQWAFRIGLLLFVPALIVLGLVMLFKGWRR